MDFTLGLWTLGLVGGFAPALLWLWFWRHEDRMHPEPRKLVFLTFFAGMLSVPLVLYLEKQACDFLATGGCSIVSRTDISPYTVLPLVIAWAAIEELAKFAAALIAVLWRHDYDEPIDALIYLLTAALGFAAIENAFFIMNAVDGGTIAAGLKAIGLRFLGASLLHMLGSAMIGIALALSFYKRERIKIEYLLTGILGAITLHTLFNFLIIESKGEKTFMVFASVWTGIILLILVFEKVKKLRPAVPFFQKS